MGNWGKSKKKKNRHIIYRAARKVKSKIIYCTTVFLSFKSQFYAIRSAVFIVPCRTTQMLQRQGFHYKNRLAAVYRRLCCHKLASHRRFMMPDFHSNPYSDCRLLWLTQAPTPKVIETSAKGFLFCFFFSFIIWTKSNQVVHKFP